MKNPYVWIRRKYRGWQVNRSIRVLDALDWNMVRAGWTRQDRRRFWRDFIKHHETRTEVLNRLTQQ